MSKYVEMMVFEDQAVNSVIDRMYYELEQGIEAKDINSVFTLSGLVAAILQNYKEPQECRNVVFLTNDADVFAFTQNELQDKLSNTGATFFKERTLLYFDTVYIEIWFVEEPLHIIRFEDIYLQQAEYINPIFY